jgi:hypothetical protein
MRVGIVTVLFKSESFLERFVTCLNAQTYTEFEVCFISNDESHVAARELVSRCAQFTFSFVENSINVGVATANNQGLDHFLADPKCGLVHFLNNDVEFDSTFLLKQVAFFERDYVDGITVKMYYFDSRAVWYGGGRLSYFKSGVVHFGHNKRDKLVGRDLFRVNYAPTCSLMIKASLLKATGVRMRDKFFAYYDDTEFCWELKEKGARLFYTPTVELLHKVSSSTGGAKSDFGRYYMTRNKYYMMRKHYNVLFLLMPLMLLIHSLLGRRIEARAIKESFKL